MSTNDIPSWVPSFDELASAYGNATRAIPYEGGIAAIRALVASRVPKELKPNHNRLYTNQWGGEIPPATEPFLDRVKYGAKLREMGVADADMPPGVREAMRASTPARESIDVERLARELFRAWCGPSVHLDSANLDNTPSLIGCWQRIARRAIELLAPPRDSSPAASGEVETARDIMDRHVSAQMHEKYAGLEAAAEEKVRAIVHGETRIFDTCIGLLDQRVSKLEVARDSSAAESGRARSLPALTRLLDGTLCRAFDMKDSRRSELGALIDAAKIELAALLPHAPSAPPTPAAPEAKPDDAEVERVARGLWSAYHGDLHRTPDAELWDEMPAQIQHGYRAEARYALSLRQSPASAPISPDEGEMKACPMCGGKADFGEVEGDADADPNVGGWFIACQSVACSCSTKLVFPLGDDVRGILRELWNRRAPAPEAERLRDLLRTVEELELHAGLAERMLLRAGHSDGSTTLDSVRVVRRGLLALARGEESEGGK